MSERRLAGLVCEGQTDVPILEGIISQLWPEVDEVRVLQPEIDSVGMTRRGGRSGWSEVKAWCEQNADQLEDVIDPPVGEPLDVLLIVVDVDIAIAAGIANPPTNVGGYETFRLCDTMKGWLYSAGRRRLPGAIVIAIPTMAIEAWIVAALFPRAKSPESMPKPAMELVRKGKLLASPLDGKPWKYLPRYREEFRRRVVSRLNAVRKACAEAERMCRKLERRRDEVES